MEREMSHMKAASTGSEEVITPAYRAILEQVQREAVVKHRADAEKVAVLEGKLEKTELVVAELQSQMASLQNTMGATTSTVEQLSVQMGEQSTELRQLGMTVRQELGQGRAEQQNALEQARLEQQQALEQARVEQQQMRAEQQQDSEQARAEQQHQWTEMQQHVTAQFSGLLNALKPQQVVEKENVQSEGVLVEWREKKSKRTRIEEPGAQGGSKNGHLTASSGEGGRF